MLPPVVEGVDHPLVCEEHGEFMVWYDDGSIESGPGELYLDCPECRYEHEHPLIHCNTCNAEKRTLKTSTVSERFDPTEAYHLECGHVVI